MTSTLHLFRPLLPKEEREYRAEMIDKAREGDRESQEWLYKFHGMVGLWDKEKQEIQKFRLTVRA